MVDWITRLFVKNRALTSNAGWKRLAPKWSELAISEAVLATLFIGVLLSPVIYTRSIGSLWSILQQ